MSMVVYEEVELRDRSAYASRIWAFIVTTVPLVTIGTPPRR